MQIGSIDNSSPKFTGYVDLTLNKAIERTANRVSKKLLKNANQNHKILKPSELETIASYRSLAERLQNYMEKLSSETVLTVVKKQDNYMELYMRNDILNTGLWFPRRGLESKKVADYNIDISAPYFSQKISPFTKKTVGIKVDKKDEDRFMKILNEFVKLLEKVNPEEIDSRLFQNSQKYGSLKEIEKRINGNMQKPHSYFQHIDYNANVDMYNEIMKVFNHQTESKYKKEKFIDIIRIVPKEKINYLKKVVNNWRQTIETKATNSKNLKQISQQ